MDTGMLDYTTYVPYMFVISRLLIGHLICRLKLLIYVTFNITYGNEALTEDMPKMYTSSKLHVTFCLIEFRKNHHLIFPRTYK